MPCVGRTGCYPLFYCIEVYLLDELLMRQVPQDLTAEQSLLGAMLVDTNCIPQVIEQVRSDDL